MSVYIHLIADYGVGDPAFAEVIQKLTLLDPDVKVHPTSVPDFSTLATGFWTAQFALVNPLPNLMIYTNVDPRTEVKSSRDKNEGSKFAYALLVNGVKVAGVNRGFCFSFLKPHIKEFHLVNVANKGSQFRSRDFYPESVIGLIHGDTKFIGEKLDPVSVPVVPPNRLAWIDGYGNLKTTVRRSTLNFTPGQPVMIELNDMKRTAFFTDGTFAVREGELAFAPGSSGGVDKFMEIFLRGLSAHHEFGKPKIESEFTITPLQ